MLVADVEAGIVTKNERRARLGLEEVAEDGSEQEVSGELVGRPHLVLEALRRELLLEG
jgi:hypothetical protein